MSLPERLADYRRRFPDWRPDGEWIALFKDMDRLEADLARLNKRAAVLAGGAE